MATEKEMLDMLNDSIARVEEAERRKSRPLRLVIGLVLCGILIFVSLADIMTVFMSLYQKDNTLSSLGGKVYAENSYIRKNQEIFNHTHLTERRPLKLVYKAEHNEKVQLIERKEFDKTVINRQHLCKVKTESGISGWTGSVFHRTEPHFDYLAIFRKSVAHHPFITFGTLSGLPHLFDREYRHILVYTLQLFLKANHRYFWFLFLSLAGIVITISFLIVRNIKNSHNVLYNPSLIISRTALIIGIVAGFFSIVFKKNATLYLAGGLEIFQFPSWASWISSPVMLWFLLYLSIIAAIGFVVAARPFDIFNAIAFPVQFAVALITGALVTAALMTGVGAAFGMVAGWIAGSLEVIFIILFIIGLFSPASSGLQSRMTKATSSIKDESSQQMQKYYTEQQMKRNSGRYQETAFGLMEKKKESD